MNVRLSKQTALVGWLLLGSVGVYAQPKALHSWDFDSLGKNREVLDTGFSKNKFRLNAKAVPGQGAGASGGCVIEQGVKPHVAHFPLPYDEFTVDMKFRLYKPLDGKHGRGLWYYAAEPRKRGKYYISISKDGRLSVNAFIRSEGADSVPNEFKAMSETLNLSVGRYYSLRCSVDAKGCFSAWLDGALVIKKNGAPSLKSMMSANPPKWHPLMRIGLNDEGAGGKGSAFLCGAVDDIAIYDKALGAPQSDVSAAALSRVSMPEFKVLSSDNVDVIVLDASGRGVTRRFTVLDHEEGALGSMMRAEAKFFSSAATSSIEVGKERVKVSFKCPVPAGMKTERSERDAWRGDCVELFIRPSWNSTEYYHYAANVAGIHFGKRYLRPDVSDAGWQSGAKAVVSETSNGFTVDFDIPLKELFKEPLKPGDSFGVNFTRSGKTAGGLSTWAAVGEKFNNIAAYGRVVYGGAERYFARRIKAIEEKVSARQLGKESKDAASRMISHAKKTVAERAKDPDVFASLDVMLGNLDKAVLEISLAGCPLLLYRPLDVWGDGLEPDFNTHPLESICLKAAKNSKAHFVFAAANLREGNFVGQLKMFDGARNVKHFNRSTYVTNGIARRFTFRRGFPILNSSRRKLYDPTYELPMKSLLRMEPREVVPVFLEFDSAGLAPGRYYATLVLKKAMPGYADVKVSVQVDVADLDVREVAFDRTGYNYVCQSYAEGMRPAYNLSKLLVDRGYNMLFTEATKMFPRIGKNGAWELSGMPKLDREIEAAIGAGLDRDRVKVWIYMGMEYAHRWNCPKNEKGGYLSFATAKYDEGVKFMVNSVAAHLKDRFGIGKDRIYWYPVDEPRGELEDKSFRSGISRAYHLAKVIKDADPANMTMTDPLIGFFSSKSAPSILARLSEVYDVMELYRPGLNERIKRMVADAGFKEIWTYSILSKETPASVYRRDYWANMRDGYREVATFWHMTSAAGGDAFDSEDYSSKGRYTDFASLYTDFDNDAALLSRRQIAADMGADDARLIMLLRKRFKNDPAMMRRIESIVKAAVDAGTMAAMDEAREELLSIGTARPESAVTRGKKMSVMNVGGVPRFAIDGKPVAATAVMPSPAGRPGAAVDVLKSFRSAGVRFASDVWTMHDKRYNPRQWWIDDGVYDFAQFDAIMRGLTEAAPDELVFPRIKIDPPARWISRNPGEMMDDVSPYPESAAWRKLYRRMLKDMIAHVEKSDYADRVVGYHIGAFSCGEWLTGEWKSPKMRAYIPESAGDKKDPFPPYSATAARRRSIERRSGSVAAMLMDAASCVKECTDGSKLVGVFFGYDSIAHEKVSAVLGSGTVDFIAAPPQYWEWRDAGFAGRSQSYYQASYRLHNSVFFEESDFRTFLSDPAFAPRGQTNRRPLCDSIGIMKRSIGKSLAGGWENWWFMLGGDETFSHPDMMSVIRTGAKESAATLNTAKWTPAEVAVFMAADEYAMARHDGISHGINAWFRSRIQIEVLPTCGVPYDCYELADIANPCLPEYSVYVFPNAFTLSGEMRRRIKDKVRRKGKTAIWFCGPGFYNGLDEGSAANVEDMTGVPVTFRPLDESKPVSRMLVPTGSAVCERDGWRSMFIPLRPNAAEMREALRNAGAHVWMETGDILAAGRGYLMVHAASDGVKRIVLPAKSDVHEIFGASPHRKGISVIEEPMKKGETRVWRQSPTDSWRPPSAIR